MWPLWRPLLIAAVLAGVLGPLHERAVGWIGGRRSLAAGLFTAATVLLILIPLTALTIVAVREAIDAVAIVRKTLKSGGIHGLIERAPDSMEYYLEEAQKHLPTKLEEAQKQIASSGKWAWGALSGTLGVLGKFGFQLAMMLIAFFFLLRDGGRLVDWLAESSPLGHRTRELLSELRAVARSVLGANFITGAVQAVVATIGFYIGRAPSPIFFGLLTLFSSLIPSVGSALVTLPVAVLVLLLGHTWAALFLAIWAMVVVGLIDNLLRPWLIRGGGAAARRAGVLLAHRRDRRRGRGGPVPGAADPDVLPRRRAHRPPRARRVPDAYLSRARAAARWPWRSSRSSRLWRRAAPASLSPGSIMRTSTPPMMATPCTRTIGASGSGDAGERSTCAKPPMIAEPCICTASPGGTMMSMPPNTARTWMSTPPGGKRASRRSSCTPPIAAVTRSLCGTVHVPPRCTPPNTANIDWRSWSAGTSDGTTVGPVATAGAPRLAAERRQVGQQRVDRLG